MLLLELNQPDPSFLKGLAVRSLVLLVAEPDAEEVPAVRWEGVNLLQRSAESRAPGQVERSGVHVVLRIFAGSTRVESSDVVDVLKVARLEVDIERCALGGKVKGVEGKMLFLPDGRDPLGQSFRLEELEKGSAAVLCDYSVVDVVDDGGAGGVAVKEERVSSCFIFSARE